MHSSQIFKNNEFIQHRQKRIWLQILNDIPQSRFIFFVVSLIVIVGNKKIYTCISFNVLYLEKYTDFFKKANPAGRCYWPHDTTKGWRKMAREIVPRQPEHFLLQIVLNTKQICDNSPSLPFDNATCLHQKDTFEGTCTIVLQITHLAKLLDTRKILCSCPHRGKNLARDIDTDFPEELCTFDWFHHHFLQMGSGQNDRRQSQRGDLNFLDLLCQWLRWMFRLFDLRVL